MKELLEYIVKSLVTKPEEIKIEEENQDNALNLKLTVAKEDMGLIIGKAGQTVKAIRKLLVARALVENNNLRVFLNLVEIDR